MPTGTDVAGTSSILLSHPLPLSVSSTLSRSLFLCSFFDQMERCSFPKPFFARRAESCDPACYLPSLPPSVSKRRCRFLSVLFHPDKGRQRPFFAPWPACALCVCTVPNRAPSLIVFLPSFCKKKVSGGPGAPALGL